MWWLLAVRETGLTDPDLNNFSNRLLHIQAKSRRKILISTALNEHPV
jgi:hypothetical protein